MKIVLLNDQLNAGGAEKVLVYIANLLFKNNYDVSVVLFLDEAKLDIQINKQIPIHYLRRTSRFDIAAWKKLKTLTNDADIVHIHSRYNLRYFMVAKIFLNIHHPKIIFHEHIPSFQLDAFTKYLFKKVNAYVAVQDAMRKWAIENKFVNQHKAFYLPNTVYPPKQAITFNTTQGKLMMIANFRTKKNHFFAIELMKALPNNYTLDLYGMIDEQEYFNQVVQAINDNHLQNRINIIQGVTDLYSIMNNYSLAIHTAYAETGPLVLIEYLYAGLPFITYQTGDVVEVIKQSLPTFVMIDFNVETWVKQILLIEKDYHATAMSDEMKQIANKHFSEQAYFNKLEYIYHKMFQ